MIKESDFETYLIVTPNHFGIYLFDKEKFKNLYQEEISFLNYENSLNLKLFYKFLDDNVFKIEKLIGKFIENIFLIINNENILNVKIGIKKKIIKKSLIITI